MDFSEWITKLLMPTLILTYFYEWRKSRNEMRKLYSGMVSKSRMEWIVEFRKEVGDISAAIKYHNNMINICEYVFLPYKEKDCLECLEYEVCKKYFCDIVLEAEKSRAILRTRLNQDIYKSGNEYNDLLEGWLKNVDFYSDKEIDGDVLILMTRDILEPEWRRVKNESEGKFY